MCADRWRRPQGSPELDRAIEFLHTTLRAGAVPTAEVEHRAEDAGISTRTLDRGRAALDVVASKVAAMGPLPARQGC
jgi:hypothetical protein